MTLGEKQEKFTRMLTKLLVFAHKQGYQIRLGHVYRCEDCPVGKDRSLHKLKLAADLNLFKDGIYLTKSKDHEELGIYWESLGGTWGGRFGDGNHYSLAHGDRK